nr:MAG TPA: hypothetical protein [Caudoviricetes sp.]
MQFYIANNTHLISLIHATTSWGSNHLNIRPLQEHRLTETALNYT